MGTRIQITPGSIEPLAVRPFTPGKIALVCEGGGQRGIFTAGVLDEFQHARFDPFSCYLGTSAGAQNLSAFVCGQQGYARRVITRYTTHSLFFNPFRFIRGGHLIDLDWLADITSQRMPLAMDHAQRRFSQGKHFYMCTCRSDNYEAHYFSPQNNNWLDIIRASSAIPGFYRRGVDFEGENWLDGGISDAIPVREAARLGAETIVVIRTVPSQMFYTPQWVKRMERWLGDSSLQPMVRMLQQHENSYRDIQRFIERPPGRLHVLEIFPPTPLASSALGSRLTSLNQDYHLGRRCGRYFLATLGQWLHHGEPALHNRYQAREVPVLTTPEPMQQPLTVAQEVNYDIESSQT
ncbi:patatin family protein [Enterobacteriaceae bacterium LUAb1]